jgi:hypothetical protein
MRLQSLSIVASLLGWTDEQIKRAGIPNLISQLSDSGLRPSTFNVAEQARSSKQLEDYTLSRQTDKRHSSDDSRKAYLGKMMQEARLCFNCQKFDLKCDAGETHSRCSTCEERNIECHYYQDEVVDSASGVIQAPALKKKDEKESLQVVKQEGDESQQLSRILPRSNLMAVPTGAESQNTTLPASRFPHNPTASQDDGLQLILLEQQIPKLLANAKQSEQTSSRKIPTAGSEAGKSPTFRNISACNICRSSKQSCDQKLPRCGNCERSDSKCVGFDPVTKREIPRR